MTYPTAAALARDLRDGRLDPVELTEAAFRRNAEVGDPAIFVELTRERGLAEARAARERLRAGCPASPLDGVPVAWKDLFDMRGRVTTAGSIVLKTEPPAAADAALVAAGARAGLVSVGCVNMTEFAYSGIGINPHYGTPRNPHDLSVHRIPGGSSSGSGVAVAQGIVPVSIGSDTSGSIRIPASFNGVVGYKASTGHYPMAGVFPLSRTLDTLGPLAQNVEDCVLADAALRGLAAPEVQAGDPRRLTFLIPEDVVFEQAQPAVLAAFDATVARLEVLGARVIHVPMPEFPEILALIDRHGFLAGPDALVTHGDRIRGPEAARLDPRVLRRILQAERMSAVDLTVLQQERRRLIAQVGARLGDAILLCPTTPTTAVPVAPLEADIEAFFTQNALTLRNTLLGNFLDFCGISIPNGTDSEGMPTGLMLQSRHGNDRILLSAALTCEATVRG